MTGKQKKAFRWTAEAKRYRALIKAGAREGKAEAEVWSNIERLYRNEFRAWRPSELAMFLTREKELFQEVAGRMKP